MQSHHRRESMWSGWYGRPGSTDIIIISHICICSFYYVSPSPCCWQRLKFIFIVVKWDVPTPQVLLILNDIVVFWLINCKVQRLTFVLAFCSKLRFHHKSQLQCEAYDFRWCLNNTKMCDDVGDAFWIDVWCKMHTASANVTLRSIKSWEIEMGTEEKCWACLLSIFMRVRRMSWITNNQKTIS